MQVSQRQCFNENQLCLQRPAFIFNRAGCLVIQFACGIFKNQFKNRIDFFFMFAIHTGNVTFFLAALSPNLSFCRL